MTLTRSSLTTAVRARLKTRLGKHFSRFVLVAVAAVAASQLTLTLCLLTVFRHNGAGKSAVAAWLAGAAVSYVLSRWAWERKGRPHLLKETLPFWIVAVGTAVVLTLTTKWANQQAISMGLSHVQRVLFADLAYFLANCVTFVTRFLIFHYILFKDRGSKVSELVLELPASEMPGARPSEMRGGRPQSAAGGFPSAAAAGEGNGSEPFAAAGSAARVNGSAWSDNTAERSPGRVPARDDAAFPEPGTRR
jgi:putative flippase GtrA